MTPAPTWSASGRVVILSAVGGVLWAAAAPPPAHAQRARDRLATLAVENARLYAGPLTTGLGVAMSQGTFYTAGVHRPLGFHAGVAAVATLVPDDRSAFRPVLPATVIFGGETFAEPYGPPRPAVETPTVAGEGEGAIFEPRGAFRDALLAAGEDPAAFALRMPAGLDLPAVPFAVAELGLGLVLGTEVAVRAIPEVEVTEDLGTVRALGAGVKHSLTQYVPGAPLDVSAQYRYQSLEVGDYVDATAHTVGLIVGKRLGILTVYGAGGLESAELDVAYTLRNPLLPEDGVRLAFTDELDTRERLTVGATLNLAVLRISGDYSFADEHAASAKLFLAFR